MNSTFGQTMRLKLLFEANPNQDLDAPRLHAVASGKLLGYCGSLSRRISDLRKLGLDVRLSRDERDEQGQRHTWYKLVKEG